MGSEDRDFRYMALNDLTNELQKETFVNMDSIIEGKVVRAVLKLMGDTSGEVQNLTVKWYASLYFRKTPFLTIFFLTYSLGPLVKQISEEQTVEIVNHLISLAAVKNQEELRGIAAMGKGGLLRLV